ncbi:MAG TPA: Asp-tRNA(Asn)/Glu-tRNA(Gln) amidotransferase subunit GatB [Trueperaceae bacterium]|nr:Asp-tRNA(Asn)/Glu-tRNA(Gln) amidotransferase subunit GatB [Trueperaceae bacterium]
MPEPVIGLEIHLAVRTESKMFCGCSAQSFGLEPNVHTCPVCLGLPGALPVTNRDAMEKAVRFSLALNCQVPERTQFHRKHYFYPDAPKNYQISQYDRPVGEHGWIQLEGGRRIGIIRCHVEEDAGRLVHPPYADHSLVDLNRAGAPLIEMVSAPDLRTPEEARAFLTQVQAIARALGVSDASPEQGKMRADVNVSLRREDGGLGTKVEVKNLNSFKSVAAALAFEIRRQGALLEEGREVAQETRGWNEGGQRTYLLRSKEESADYRYMPEPDLPPLALERAWLERIRDTMPELPEQKRERYLEKGLRAGDAELIAFDVHAAALFDAATAAYAPANASASGSDEPGASGAGSAQAIANWLVGDVAGLLNAEGTPLAGAALRPEHLAALVRLIDEGVISGKIAKEILPEVVAGESPEAVVERKGLKLMQDEGALAEVVERVIEANPAIVESVAENPKAVNALLGRVMKETRGTARPEAVRKLLLERLGVEAG